MHPETNLAGEFVNDRGNFVELRAGSLIGSGVAELSALSYYVGRESPPVCLGPFIENAAESVLE